jgi:DNA-binding CsgD family transcriptional regulator
MRCVVTRTEVELHAYVHQLEDHLRLAVFGGDNPDPESAVLLVRGALAADDEARATDLAEATEMLAADSPAGDAAAAGDMAAAAAHVRGLVDQDSAVLEYAAVTYLSPLGRAWATEDAGMAWAQRGNRAAAVDRLHEAYALYEQLGATDSLDRVRARLRATGVRMRHWKSGGRPAFGWDSLTDTERRIVHLVAQGCSNRQIASQMFLSVHTIAFHLRRVFCKLDVSSRVQLASLAAEQVREGAGASRLG